MTRLQRIIVVVATGAVCAVAADTLGDRWFQPDGGWFMVAPDSSVLYSAGPSLGDRIGTAALRVTALGLWLGASVRILRPGDR